jgi:hypothetical protein
MNIDAQIFGDKEFLQSLYGFPRALRRRTIEAIHAAARMYAEGVASNELAGGVLKARSHKLQRSMVIKSSEHSDQIEALVYPKAKYGWMLARGTPKNEVEVRAHPRFVEGAGDVSVISRVFKVRAGRRSRKHSNVVLRRVAIFAKSSVPVKRHIRKMLLARIARPFMGPAYERMKPLIEERLRYALIAAQADAMEGLDVEEHRGTS